jgi:lysophospholipase L1-like esterase
VLATLAGCGGSSSSTASSSATPATSTPAPSPTGAPNQLYVSVGDTYAAGYQATGRNVGNTNRNGFAYQVVDGAKAKGYDLTLTNFGCGGATTTSLLQQAGCRPDLLGPGASSYDPSTQVDAAETFLRANKGRVALLTVSIGGNDVTACGVATDPVACVTTAAATIKSNLGQTLKRLRDAAGPDTRIVGITYPDVILGEYLSADPKRKALAGLSVVAFKSLINPALKAEYEKVGGELVDVTEATGAYEPLTQTTDLAPYGTIPDAVAKVCQLTYYCEFGDIHPRTDGYKVISDLIVGTLPKR